MKKLTFFLCAVFLTMIGNSYCNESLAGLESAMGNGNGTFSSYSGLTWSPMGVLTWNDAPAARVVAIPGEVCGNPIQIASLPYTTTDDTSLYLDDYSSGDRPPLAPGAVGNPSANYLGGDDVVYAYTPAVDGSIDITVTNHDAWTGVFVFTGCPFTSTVGGQTNSSATAVLEVPALPVVAGETYYIVISTWPAPQSTTYTLSVSAASFDCPDLEANIGDPCDDGDPNTVGDRITADCQCEGIVPGPGADCEAAIALDCNAEPVTYTSLGSAATNTTTCSMGNSGLWFTFTGTGNTITINSTATFDHEMSINSGSCGQLQNIVCRDLTTGAETYTLATTVSGQSYYVYIAHFASGNTTTGEITVSLECDTTFDCPELQANIGDPCDDGDPNTVGDVITANCECVGIVPGPGSDCEAAIALDCNAEPGTYSSEGSTATNTTSCTMGSSGLWFSFMGTGSDITVSAIASFDLEMSVNSGACGNLTNLDCIDDELTATPETYTISPSVSGETYYVYVAHWSGSSSATGTITIGIECATIPECTAPELTLAVQDANGGPIEGCLEAGDEYYVLASLSGGSGNTSYNVTANGGDPTEVAANSSEVLGPFAAGTDVTVTAVGAQDDDCSVTESVDSPAMCPPSNDSCEEAIMLDCNAEPMTYSSEGSTATNTTSCTMGSSGIWFSFMGTGADITVTAGASFDIEMSVNSGSCGDLINLDCIDDELTANPETYTISPSVSGETYYVYVAHWSGSSSATGTITIGIECATIPECTAPELTLAVQDANGGPIEGCLEAGDEYYVLASLSGGSGNTSYNVTANGGDPTEVAADGSVVLGPFTAGTDVDVTAVGVQDDDCSVTASVDSPALCPPANDNCEDAIMLDCNAEPVTYSSEGSTATNTTSCTMGSSGIWFSFMGTGADITVTAGASFDIEMSVNSGSCGDLTNLACADNEITANPETYTISPSVSGEMYYVYVAHWSSSSSTTGLITIGIECETVSECTSPELTLEVQDANGDPIEGCVEEGSEYYVWATLSGGSGNSSYDVTANGGDPITVNADDSVFLGPFTAGTDVEVVATGNDNDACGATASINSPEVCSTNEDYFITTWETTMSNESITIPTIGGGYNYSVIWGDGTSDSGITGDATHTYSSPGTYTVKISGDFPRIYFNNSGNSRLKIRTIEQWGTNEWTSMNGAFAGATYLVSNATDMPDLSMVNDMYGMFAFARSFKGDANFGNWDVSNVTNMYGMFGGASVFNHPIGGWDVSNVTNMENMFNGATIFNQDLSGWDVGNVTNMSKMFRTALYFNQDIGGWDVSNVTNMSDMFAFARRFDQDLGNWDVSNVINMTRMFLGAKLSTANYDSLLIGWSSLPLQSNVNFHGGTSNYCAGQSARDFIISTYNWTIIDGGLDCTNPLVVGDRLNVGNTGSLSGVTLYPNPMKAELNLGNPNQLEIVDISIFDMTGRLVQKVDLHGMTTGTVIDVSNLSSATYMVLINGKDGQTSNLMIKE